MVYRNPQLDELIPDDTDYDLDTLTKHTLDAALLRGSKSDFKNWGSKLYKKDPQTFKTIFKDLASKNLLPQDDGNDKRSWAEVGKNALKDILPNPQEIFESAKGVIPTPWTMDEFTDRFPENINKLNQNIGKAYAAPLVGLGKVADMSALLGYSYLPKKIAGQIAKYQASDDIKSGDIGAAIDKISPLKDYGTNNFSDIIKQGLSPTTKPQDIFSEDLIKDYPKLTQLVSGFGVGDPNSFLPEHSFDNPIIDKGYSIARSAAPIAASLLSPLDLIGGLGAIGKFGNKIEDLSDLSKVQEIPINHVLDNIFKSADDTYIEDVAGGSKSFIMDPSEASPSEVKYFTSRPINNELNIEDVSFPEKGDELASLLSSDESNIISSSMQGNRYPEIISENYSAPYFSAIPDRMQLLESKNITPGVEELFPQGPSPYFPTVPDRMQNDRIKVFEGEPNNPFIYKSGELLDEQLKPMAEDIFNSAISTGGQREVGANRFSNEIDSSFIPYDYNKDAKDIGIKRDVKGWLPAKYSTDSAESIIRKTLDDETSQNYYGAFNQSKGQAADFVKNQTKIIYDNVVKGLGIKENSKLDKALFRYAHGLPGYADEADLYAKFGRADGNKIIKAKTFLEGWYQDIYDAINEVRAKRIENGEKIKLLPKVDNYFRWASENKTLMNELGFGKGDFFLDARSNLKPLAGEKELSIFKSRGQLSSKIKETGVGGVLNYIPQAAFDLHINQHLPRMEDLASKIKEKAPESASKIGAWIDDLKGMNPRSRIERVANGVHNIIAKSLVGLNPRTAFIQPVNLQLVASDAAQYIPAGIKLTSTVMNKEHPFWKGTFFKERYGKFDMDKFEKNFFKKSINITIKPLAELPQFTELMAAIPAWNTYYAKALSEGKVGQKAINYADSMARTVFGGRGVGDMPLWHKKTLGKVLTPFTYESHQALKKIADNVKLGPKTMLGLMLSSGAGYLMNQGLEQAGLNPVAIDPAGDMISAVESWDPKESTAYNVQMMVPRALGSELKAHPAGNYIPFLVSEFGKKGVTPPREGMFPDQTRFGPMPIIDAIQNVHKDIGSVSDLDSYLENFTPEKIPKSPFYLLPGGQSLRRAIIGGMDVSRGKYSTKYQNKEYEVPLGDSLGDYLQAMGFGVSSLPEVQEFYKSKAEEKRKKQK